MSFQIDSDFPGGNIVVECIEGQTLFLRPDLRDTAGRWFYWCFRVRGAAGQTLRFVFSQEWVLGLRGPAVSVDQGASWAWVGNAHVEGNGFSFAFPADAMDVRFSFAMPYQVARWADLVARHASSSLLVTEPLCTSAKGRSVECTRLGCLGREPAHRVLITARHHCCEMMASYALEGLVEFVLRRAEPAALWLCEQVELLLIPFVDQDGVEEGDQGKNRRPHDHNRDYAGDSLYASTAAIRQRVPGWAAGRLRVALDLHCPWVTDQRLFLVGGPDPRQEQEQRAFSALLQRHHRGPLPFLADDFFPFGQGWNTAASYASGKSFSTWAGELPGIQLASSIEIPYADVKGVEVNPASAGAFGQDLARALWAYLVRPAWGVQGEMGTGG